MKITAGIGGIVAQFGSRHICIFPANVWFVASKNVLVFCRIGFSISANATTGD